MKKTTRTTLSIYIIALVMLFVMAGPITVFAEEQQGTQTTIDKGIIEVVVWDDLMVPDQSSVTLEGVNSIKVKLFRMIESSGIQTWVEIGEKETTLCWLSPIDCKYYGGGWAAWTGLPVVEGSSNQYKLVLVEDGSFKPLNGVERFVDLKAENNYRASFNDPKNPEESTYSAFKIRCTGEPHIINAGTIDVVVWDDLVRSDISDPKLEGVDGITINLYSLDENGAWQLYGSKKTGYGVSVLGEIVEHGWAGWRNLPIMTDLRAHSLYKIVLVTDNTFISVNGLERIADLNATNNHYRWFFELGEDAELRAYQIRSTTGTISGVVWYDANADQVREWHEPVQSGWTVVLTNKYGIRIATTTTDARGYYQFRGLKAGTYKVWVAEKSGWKQVYPYYKLLTIPPWGCEKGHHTINVQAGKYYVNNDFGMLSMQGSSWATLYYVLWWVGLLQYQFQ